MSGRSLTGEGGSQKVAVEIPPLRPFNEIEFLFFEWIERRVRASPDAAWTPIQVAGEPVAAAVCQDACRLIGHDVRRVDHLRLQANFLVYMLAVLDSKRLPGFLSHRHTPFGNLVYP